MSTGDVMKRMQRLDFPECTDEALKYIVTSLTSQEEGRTAIPGLSGGPDTAIGQICQRFIHFKTVHGNKVLNPLQELELLQMLCEFFKGAPEKHKYRLFQLMFGGPADDQASGLLEKVVSLALSLSYKSVLDCTAIWMQEPSHRGQSLQLARRLVEDFCLLYQDPTGTFRGLPSTSALFVCNLTTTVTTLFSLSSPESLPPVSLLEHVAAWITQDVTLCCESLRQLPIHGTFSSPIPGLLGWCVLGPVVCTQLLEKMAPSSNTNTNTPTNGASSTNCDDSATTAPSPASSAAPRNSNSNKKRKQKIETLTQTMAVLSRLHLGLLQSVEFFTGASLSQCLLSVSDAVRLLTQLTNIINNKLPAKSAVVAGGDGGGGDVDGRRRMVAPKAEVEAVGVAMERLAQVLQVSRMAGCLAVESPGALKELADLAANRLPSNRLFSIVLSTMTGSGQHQQQHHPPTSAAAAMETS